MRLSKPPGRVQRDGGTGPLSSSLLRRALEIFYARHHSVEFCSFLHVPSLDIEVLRHQSPFFAHALVALAGLYMSKEEAVSEGFADPAALSDWYTIVAREYSRQSVDVPSSKYAVGRVNSPFIILVCNVIIRWTDGIFLFYLVRSIQANLILALRELLARTLYKAWIFSGVAIRQAQALRLGQEYHHRLSDRQKEVQRRTYWAAFIMDRLSSYYCWRPQMLDTDCVRLNLPCPENLFIFEESFEGPNLETLTFPCEVSRLGLVPYFIAVLNLWSQATYTQVKGGRRLSRHDPNDPHGPLRQLETKIDHIQNSLPLNMRWSTQNRNVFRHMNQEALFTNFHFLLHHARCAMYEEYLPYRDITNPVLEQETRDDTAESSYLDERDERIASICVSSSGAIVDIVSDLFAVEESSTCCGTRILQSVFAAAAMLSAANIQLWLRHVEGRVRGDDKLCTQAAARVDQINTVFDSWRPQWPVAEAWMSTLASLRRLYQVTYDPDSNLDHLADGEGHHDGNNADPDLGVDTSSSAVPPAPTESDVYERPYPRLTEGNGLPLLNERMSDKVRFILLASLEDTGARERVLHSSMNSSLNREHHNAWEYEEFSAQDLEFPFSDLFPDETWC